MTESTCRTICLYGASGVGKSAQAARFARWIYETTGRITRAIVSDLGSSLAVMSEEIRVGLVEAWWIGKVPDPARVMRKLSRGAWPVVDGSHLRFTEATADTWRRIGGLIIDSGTEVAESILNTSLRGSGVRLSEGPNYTVSEGDETFHGSNQSYYGFAQDEMLSLIHAFSALPVPVLWTFGEQQGIEEGTKSTIMGPETVGKARALTGKLPKKFGDTLHLEQFFGAGPVDLVTQKTIQIPVWRIYFISHLDPATGMPYPAKPRLPPVVWPELLKRWPRGFLTPAIQDGDMVEGLDALLRLEEDLIRQPGRLGKWKADLDVKNQAAGIMEESQQKG